MLFVLDDFLVTGYGQKFGTFTIVDVGQGWWVIDGGYFQCRW